MQYQITIKNLPWKNSIFGLSDLHSSENIAELKEEVFWGGGMALDKETKMKNLQQTKRRNWRNEEREETKEGQNELYRCSLVTGASHRVHSLGTETRGAQ